MTRFDAVKGIQNDHAAGPIAQPDRRQIARRSETGGSPDRYGFRGESKGYVRLLSTIAVRYKNEDVDCRKSEKSRFRTELI
jgi:hypothetical protein